MKQIINSLASVYTNTRKTRELKQMIKALGFFASGGFDDEEGAHDFFICRRNNYITIEVDTVNGIVTNVSMM